jgi:hypothetical protein
VIPSIFWKFRQRLSFFGIETVLARCREVVVSIVVATSSACVDLVDYCYGSRFGLVSDVPGIVASLSVIQETPFLVVYCSKDQELMLRSIMKFQGPLLSRIRHDSLVLVGASSQEIEHMLARVGEESAAVSEFTRMNRTERGPIGEWQEICQQLHGRQKSRAIVTVVDGLAELKNLFAMALTLRTLPALPRSSIIHYCHREFLRNSN